MTDVIIDGFLCVIEQWYEERRQASGHVNTNVMTVGLIMIEHMARGYPFKEEEYLAKSQVKGISGQKIADILARCGEHRKFTSEGGRTSRDTITLAKELAEALNAASIGSDYRGLVDEGRARVGKSLQAWFVDRVRKDYFDKQYVKAVDFSVDMPVDTMVASFLKAARLRGGNSAGAVAQRLVGATLAIRFPDLAIANEGYTTADWHTDRPADFKVGDTAIHVTISPSDELFRNRCAANLQGGFKCLVLVSAGAISAAFQLAANADIDRQISVNSIESFVGVIVDGLAAYSNRRREIFCSVLKDTTNGFAPPNVILLCRSTFRRICPRIALPLEWRELSKGNVSGLCGSVTPLR
jgi:hypothetical protein